MVVMLKLNYDAEGIDISDVDCDVNLWSEIREYHVGKFERIRHK